ncbi:hypothetical protein ACLB1R_24795 [Escherichia coli]
MEEQLITNSVKLIPKDLKCTVVSNNIPILHLLSDYQNVEVIGLGGRLYKNSLVLIGAETLFANFRQFALIFISWVLRMLIAKWVLPFLV